MITTIGEGCFLQNWLYMKAKQNGIESECCENILSRIQAHNPVIWNKRIILEKLQRYDDFCANFIKTGKVVGHEFVSDEEQCKRHFSRAMNLKEMSDNLKNAKVVLYLSNFCTNSTDALANINSVYENLRKISNAYFIAFSRHIKTTKVNDKFEIIYLPDYIAYNKDQSTYVPHWNVSEKNKNILDKAFQKIFVVEKKA